MFHSRQRTPFLPGDSMMNMEFNEQSKATNKLKLTEAQVNESPAIAQVKFYL